MSAGLGEAGSVTVVDLLGLDGGEVVDGLVGSFVVEPVDPIQDGDFELVTVTPGAVGMEQLSFEQPDLGLRESVVVGVADGPDGRVDPGLCEPVGEGDRGVLGCRRRCDGSARSGR